MDTPPAKTENPTGYVLLKISAPPTTTLLKSLSEAVEARGTTVTFAHLIFTKAFLVAVMTGNTDGKLQEAIHGVLIKQGVLEYECKVGKLTITAAIELAKQAEQSMATPVS